MRAMNRNMWVTIKTLLTFHDNDWWISIQDSYNSLLHAYCNPHLTALYNPLYTANNQGIGHCIVAMANHWQPLLCQVACCVSRRLLHERPRPTFSVPGEWRFSRAVHRCRPWNPIQPLHRISGSSLATSNLNESESIESFLTISHLSYPLS